MNGAPRAGWYPVLRYWDGEQWTNDQQDLPPQPQFQPQFQQPMAARPMTAITRPTFWSGGVKGMMFNRSKTTIK